MNFFRAFCRTVRFCFRNKSLTFINIFGLGMGLAVTMFLLVYLSFELSYDRHFSDSDRIYRVLSIWEEENETEYLPICLRDFSARVTQDIPEVEAVAQLFRADKVLRRVDKPEEFNFIGYNVDSLFFKVFDFKKVYGELEGIFTEPGQCVLVRSAAEKIFGKGVNPVGQYLDVGGKQACRIVAVIEDVPFNSHFKFGVLSSMPSNVEAYGGLEFFTYLKFREDIDIPGAVDKCDALNKKLLEDLFASDVARFGSVTEPLASLHTSTLADFDLSPTNKLSGLFFVILVGVLILGIAISNFISLFMIQGEKRSLEVGIRKVGGASRWQIVGMLFGETLLITFLAFALALALFCFLSESLAGLLNIYIPHLSWNSWDIWVGFAWLYVVTVLCAGSYPAWNLSRSQPVELIGKSVVRKFRLTVASVIVQFSVVIFCVSALWVVMRQLDYVMKQPFGFATENVMCFYARMNRAQGASISAELLTHSCVLGAGLSRGAVDDQDSGGGIRRVGQSEREEISVNERNIGIGYLEALEIPLLAGRGFTGQAENDQADVILSETAVKALQLDEPVVGRKVILANGDVFTVIGVARDCRYGSARRGIGKVIYSSYRDVFYRLYVRFRPGEYKEAREVTEAALKKHFPEILVGMSFLKDDIALNYTQDRLVARMLEYGVILTVVLALLGLVALCGFVARQKSKEISIRRVSGAYIDDILIYMLRYILWRIIPAIPVGVAVSYFVMSRWLSEFQFAITISWWIYGMTIMVILLSVAAVVFLRSWKIATTNPVEALKSE